MQLTLTDGMVKTGETRPAEVGRTRDACSKDNLVTLRGKDSEVSVKAGQKVFVELLAPTRELDFYCGGTPEVVKNDQPFNWVLIQRSSDTGAIRWTFYLEL